MTLIQISSSLIVGLMSMILPLRTLCLPVNQNVELGCHLTPYEESMEKETYITELGERLYCNGIVEFDICWGRCESKEVLVTTLSYMKSTSRHIFEKKKKKLICIERGIYSVYLKEMNLFGNFIF